MATMAGHAAEDVRGAFTSGQPVEVWVEGVFQYTATVVRYARCGAFTVRDHEFGTFCDYLASELRPISA